MISGKRPVKPPCPAWSVKAAVDVDLVDVVVQQIQGVADVFRVYTLNPSRAK